MINPKAVAAMKELGYDLTTHGSKSLDDLPKVEFDLVATMGCGDVCPFFPGKQYVDWNLPDPVRMTVDEVRDVRDDIERRIAELAG